jgi:hypothetical protein
LEVAGLKLSASWSISWRKAFFREIVLPLFDIELDILFCKALNSFTLRFTPSNEMASPMFSYAYVNVAYYDAGE